MSARKKDEQLALIGHVEHETDDEARKRRKAEKRQRSEHMASIARKPRSLLRRVIELGGISAASWSRFPGDRALSKQPRARGLVRRSGGNRWDYVAQALAGEGYVDPDNAEQDFIDKLDESLRAGADFFSQTEGASPAEADIRAMLERVQATTEPAPRRRANGGQRERLRSILDTLDGASPSTLSMLRTLIRRAPDRELPRLARIVSSMVRGQAAGTRARKGNPHLLTIGNPEDIAAAVRAYERFHGVKPKPGQIHHGRGKGILIALGELDRIDYRPRRGDRAGPIWFHHFKPGCVLCTDPDGRRLVVLDRSGKRLVDFDRGIIR